MHPALHPAFDILNGTHAVTKEKFIHLAPANNGGATSTWDGWLSDLPVGGPGQDLQPDGTAKLWPLIANLPVSRAHGSCKATTADAHSVLRV